MHPARQEAVIMVSVEKWKNHFKRFAHKAFPGEDVYIVPQTGRGLGRNAYKKTLYQIRTPAGNSSSKPTIEIVSPVASSVERAKALTKTIKKRRKKKSSSTATKPQGRKKGKGRKKKKKKSGPKKKKAAKKAPKKKKKSKKGGKKKK